MPSLSLLCREYAAERAVSNAAAYQLRWAVGLFEQHLGREAERTDLTRQVVNEWLASVRTIYAPRSARNARASILTLWRWLAEFEGHPPPTRIARVRVPRRAPVAWSIGEVRQLLAATDCFEGTRGDGVPWSVYLRALILVAWDTGLRRGDLWSLTRAELGDGACARTQHKTGGVVSSRLSPDAAAAVALLPGDRPLAPIVWPRAFYRHWSTLLRLAGLSGKGSALQRLRRSAATDVALHRPGSASQFLGHATPGLAQASYLDPRILYPRPIGPTPLE